LDDGTGNDDHPHADIREGDLFLHNLFEAVANGPAWSSTVIVFNFDEWGGFFEHVAPPRATAANSIDTDIVNGKTLLGFRLPVVIASPFSRGNAQNPLISSLVYDHTSVLKLIEWRWGLAPLTPRDGSSDINNLAYALNFSSPQTAVPSLPITVRTCHSGSLLPESGRRFRRSANRKRSRSVQFDGKMEGYANHGKEVRIPGRIERRMREIVYR
jgi:phospholipase C